MRWYGAWFKQTNEPYAHLCVIAPDGSPRSYEQKKGKKLTAICRKKKDKIVKKTTSFQ